MQDASTPAIFAIKEEFSVLGANCSTLFSTDCTSAFTRLAICQKVPASARQVTVLRLAAVAEPLPESTRAHWHRSGRTGACVHVENLSGIDDSALGSET